MHPDIFHVFTVSIHPISLEGEAKLLEENGGARYFFLLQPVNVTNTHPSDSLYCMEAKISQFLHAIIRI